MKTYIKGIVIGIISILLALCVVGIPYVSIGEFQLGWVLGLAAGIVGVALCRRNRERSKVKAALVLCVIGVVLSVANLGLSAAAALGMM